jgi:inhibitor of KinA
MGMAATTYNWTEEMLSPLGEHGIVIRCGSVLSEEVHQRVMSVSALLEKGDVKAAVEWVPSYLSVTLFYDPLLLSYDEISSILLQRLSSLKERDHLDNPHECGKPGKSKDTKPKGKPASPRIMTIPVCYGGEFGPDIAHVAAEHDLTTEEVVAIHSSVDYLVHMIGFAPGFPYLGGLPERIATPRRGTPRLRVEAGTVGIGGSQTGIYPIATPGGWQCIGRTPVRLFRPELNSPSLLKAGDVVRFQPITMQEYVEMARREVE